MNIQITDVEAALLRDLLNRIVPEYEDMGNRAANQKDMNWYYNRVSGLKSIQGKLEGKSKRR